MATNARIEAVKALQKMHLSNGYSHIVLDNLLQQNTLSSEEDRALLSRLVYGVEERRLTLDALLGSCCRRPLNRLHPCVWEILRVGAYQLLFMDRIPDSAAVNEAVKASRLLGQGQASGFINGVLRSVARQKDVWWNSLPEDDHGLSLRYSCPEELICLWRDSYGEDRMRALLSSLNEAPPTVLRLNSLRCTWQDWDEFAAQQEIAYAAVPGLPYAVEIKGGLSRKKLAIFKEKCYYQDKASQWCVCALDAQPGESLADVCAAPGGKSMTAAQYMQNRGRILCGDIHPDKCDIIAKRASEYGFSIITTGARDASRPCPAPLRGQFDRVICDVPCSGLGVIRRKPEIRYRALAETADLPQLQFQILQEAANMVRPGGVLQYSTCTLRPAENEEVVARFLQAHPEFEPRNLPVPELFEALGEEPGWQITLFPPVHGSDGFFMAGMTRRREE